MDAPAIRTLLVAGGIAIKEQLNDLQRGVRLDFFFSFFLCAQFSFLVFIGRYRCGHTGTIRGANQK